MLAYLIVGLCLVCGLLILVGIFDVKERRQRKNGPKVHERDGTEDCDIQEGTLEFNEIGARIIEQRCGVDVRGTKSVFVGEKYCIVFLTDDGRTLEYFVPEETYLALDKGQRGILVTTAKGAFYGFAVDEE